MGDLWEKIRKSVIDGVQAAAEKTEELTKLGKIKIEILNIKRKISKNFTELGGITYEAIKESTTKEELKSDKVNAIIEKLKELDSELEAKEKLYEDSTKKGKSE